MIKLVIKYGNDHDNGLVPEQGLYLICLSCNVFAILTVSTSTILNPIPTPIDSSTLTSSQKPLQRRNPPQSHRKTSHVSLHRHLLGLRPPSLAALLATLPQCAPRPAFLRLRISRASASTTGELPELSSNDSGHAGISVFKWRSTIAGAEASSGAQPRPSPEPSGSTERF